MSDASSSPSRARAGEARAEFERLAADLFTHLRGAEVLICNLHGEDSDFVRFNHGDIRQAGSVTQRSFSMHLIDGARHAVASVSLSGDAGADRKRLERSLQALREQLPHLPEDPFLNFATDARSSERSAENEIPSAGETVDRIRTGTAGRDLVGIYASGDIYAGLANSLGQRNWYDTRNFNLDWSFYLRADKAVKSAYAGLSWDDAAFARKVETATRQLAALEHEPHSVPPGSYRVYLAPAAVRDVLHLLSWGGFGLKAVRTRQSPLLKLATGEVSFDERVRIRENTQEGIAPDFEAQGYPRPPSVDLVDAGHHAGALVSPRSAKEYGVETNGASAMEAPESIEMAAGGLPQENVLTRLGTGVYVGNVWYLNYSDRNACRTTGMTRFATYWVENGEIVAPLQVMRFDETVYDMFGRHLVDLTDQQEFVLDPSSYFQRATTCGRYPGALVEAFRFTL